MSEYQYVAFRAVDGPVSAQNLEYMRRQSSRAEVTPWSFDNECHFGDFHGDALEMLRRGYDIHLHYANFGVRKLLIRFPHGLSDHPELQAAAAEIQQAANRQAAENAARLRTKRLAALATDPRHALRETENLVMQRNVEAYRQIGGLLAELRDALAGTDQAGLAEQQAQKLKGENPTLRMLVSELRRAGFLKK